MTYETQELEGAYFSWLSDEDNAPYQLNPPTAPFFTPYEWPELADHERIGDISGKAATPEARRALNLIADRQQVSPTTEDISPTIGENFPPVSLELFQEMIWDRTEALDMTDEEVRDLAVWAGHKFLNFSLAKSGLQWGVTKKQAESIVKRFDRREEKPQGLIDLHNAALVTAMGV